MTREEMNFIGGMNMCDEISNEAYKKIMCHCEEQEPILDKIRAEIDKIYEREGSSVDCLNALDDLKWFIDKCSTESEG